jgi:hypothetical protein
MAASTQSTGVPSYPVMDPFPVQTTSTNKKMRLRVISAAWQHLQLRPPSPTPSATCHSGMPAPPPSPLDTHIKMRSLKQIKPPAPAGARSRGPITSQGKRNSSRSLHRTSRRFHVQSPASQCRRSSIDPHHGRRPHADATQAQGAPRDGLFTCEGAKKAAMGTVARGKQNNLRISARRQGLVDWAAFCSRLKDFL